MYGIMDDFTVDTERVSYDLLEKVTKQVQRLRARGKKFRATCAHEVRAYGIPPEYLRAITGYIGTLYSGNTQRRREYLSCLGL
jgi:hypothetical protein